MRYLCIHCGAGGACGRPVRQSPASFHCHRKSCGKRDAMYPEPVVRLLFQERERADALEAHVERLSWHAEMCANELAAMIDRHNKQNMEDGSWEYDHQTPHDLMMVVRDRPATTQLQRSQEGR